MTFLKNHHRRESTKFPPLQAVQCGNLRSCQQSSSEEVASDTRYAEKYGVITEIETSRTFWTRDISGERAKEWLFCKKKRIPMEAQAREEYVSACLNEHSTGPLKAIFKKLAHATATTSVWLCSDSHNMVDEPVKCANFCGQVGCSIANGQCSNSANNKTKQRQQSSGCSLLPSAFRMLLERRTNLTRSR